MLENAGGGGGGEGGGEEAQRHLNNVSAHLTAKLVPLRTAFLYIHPHLMTKSTCVRECGGGGGGGGGRKHSDT